MKFPKIQKKILVFHSDFGQSRWGGHKMPPPMAQDAFERVWLVGLNYIQLGFIKLMSHKHLI